MTHSRRVGGQNRAEVAHLFINVLRFLYGLRDFLAEQCAITLSQLMDKTLHRSLRNAESFRELRIRNILSFRGEAIAQHIKYATPSTGFALFAQTSQSMFHCCGRPPYIKNFFSRPTLSLPRGNCQIRWGLRHPFVPRDKFHVAAAFARAFADRVVG